MNEILALLYDNFFTLSFSIGLGIIMLANKSMDRRTRLYFLCFLVTVLLLDISDMADHYLSRLSAPNPMHYMTSALGYSLRPAALALIICILLRRWKTGFVLWLPVILSGLVAFSSIFTRLMFWFDDGNSFMRGPLSFLPHILSAFYMALLLALTFRMYRRISVGEVLIILYCAVLCATATLIESVTSLKFLLTGAMLTACSMYYIFLCVQIYSRDALTGLPNRRSFYNDAQSIGRRNSAVISADMNGLKEINDTRGHGAGDSALQRMADILSAKSGRAFRAYRIGGDEYMLLGIGQPAEAADALIAELRDELTAEGLSASFGYAPYLPGDNFDDVCNQADTRMYDDKSRFHHRTSARD